MIIREATSTDTTSIVELLKSSLGESFIKKSKVVWDFKHNQNPFGISDVLLAFEDDQLIGVRAFMQWKWQIGDKIWIAYRAVDTATHPAHQGKGIFKKLTLKALEDVRAKWDAFVFNTPNEKSRPGYLKMGWKIVDSIPIALVPTALYFLPNLFAGKSNLDHSIDSKRLDEICTLHNYKLSKSNTIFTPKSAAYLKWRFEQNPMQEYSIISTKDWYIALYVKKRSFINELRVAEIIYSNEHKDLKAIGKAIIHFAIKNKCLIVTLANKNIFKGRIFGKFGPKLTFMPLTEDKDFINIALDIHNWKYSLGDLELF